MAFDKANRPEGGFKRRGGGRRRKKVCVFCGKENNEIDYKDVAKLRKYISRQDPSQKNYRQLRKAPESSDGSDQESTSHRSDAVCTGLIDLVRYE